MRKFDELNGDKQQEIANKLSLFLLKYYGDDYYHNVQSLRDDFIDFRKTIIYQKLIEKFKIENNVDIDSIAIANNWQICRVCDKPFISFAKKKSKVCRYETYIKMTKDGKMINQKNKRSVCQMISRQNASMKYVNKTNERKDRSDDWLKEDVNMLGVASWWITAEGIAKNIDSSKHEIITNM